MKRVILGVLLVGCHEQRAARACVEADRAAENAAIIACIAAGQRSADDDADELAEACAKTMRDSLCTRWVWQVQEWHAGGGYWWPIARCDAANATQQQICRNYGWQR